MGDFLLVASPTADALRIEKSNNNYVQIEIETEQQ